MSDPEERFTVACPKCNKRYVVTVSVIGKKATCKCGRSFLIEKPPEDLEDEGGEYGMAESQPAS
jgi:transcription elongation factor Elf1